MSGGDLADELEQAHAQQQAAQAYAAGFTNVPQLEGLQQAYPNLGAAALPLAAAGVTPDSPVARKAAEAKTKRDRQTLKAGEEKSGGFLHRFVQSVHNVESGALGKAADVARPIVRYGSAGAEFPVQLTQAAIRGTAYDMGLIEGDGHSSFTDMLKQTTIGAGIAEAHDRGQLGQALADVVTPGTADEQIGGSGWFIGHDSHTAHRQAAEARAAGLVDGHAATLGRITAHGAAAATQALPTGFTPNVMEPGHIGYRTMSGLVDLWANIALDPSTVAGTKLAEAQRLRNVIDRGDMVEVALPTRRTLSGRVHPSGPAGTGVAAPGQAGAGVATADSFDLADAGVVEGLRKTYLPEKAAQWLMGPKGNKVVQHLADATDFETLRRATGKKLPTQVLLDLLDTKDTATVRNILADAVRSGDMREALKFRPALVPPPRLAGMMPGDKIDLENIDDAVEQLDRFQRNVRLPRDVISRNNEALARAHTGGERYQVVSHVMRTIEDSLVHSGVKRRDASAVTRMFEDARESMRKYYVDEIGDNAHILGVTIGADGRPLPSPHLLNEMLDRYIPLPDARELKRATREYEAVKKIEQSWAYKGPRVAADFLTTNLFKPFALALRPAWTVRVVGEEQIRMAAAGKDSLFRHPLSYISWIAGDSEGKLGKLVGRGGQDALGHRWADEAAVPDAVTEWAQALNHGSAGWADRTRIQLRHWTTYAAHEPEYADAWHGELVKLASDPVAREALRNGAQVAKDKFWAGNLQRVRADLAAGMPHVDFTDRAVADQYVDTILERIQVKTQGNAELIDAVKTGKLRGHALSDGFNNNPKVRGMLQDMADAGMGPKKVAGRLTARANKDSVGAAFEMYDKVVERLFHALGSVPTNKLSRSPMFRQSYWQRVEETLPLMRPAERARAIRAAKDAGLSEATVTRMRKTVARQKHGGDLALEDVDRVAKQYALHETRDLLYSLHEKSQAADALRVLFPFGEAWREVLTRWARLGVDPRTMNPLVPYRAFRGFQGAEDAGIFYNDPTTGQEMFALPGSEWLSDKLFGVPMKLEAPVSGLNMFGQVIPGVGPVVAMLASHIIPQDPAYDDVRNMLLPFGETDTSGGLAESMLPSYVKKIAAVAGGGTASQKRALASTTADVMAYLYSTGDYNLADPASQQKLLDDAKGKAKGLYLLRALAQSTAPSSPRGAFAAKDKDGRLHALWQLKNDYRKMLDHNPKTATTRFLDKYGQFAFLVTVGKTADTGANPPTDAADRLARSHPDQAERFPNVIGLFADPSDGFSFTEENRQLEAGTRKVNTLPEIIRLGNQRVATAIYAQAKAKHGDDDAFMSALHDRLVRKYPGWTGKPGDLGKTDELVAELQKAAGDDVLAKTDAGRGLRIYLRLRQEGIDAARAGGVKGWQQANSTEAIRAWLYRAGTQIGQDYPGFQAMFERVFARELPDQGGK